MTTTSPALETLADVRRQLIALIRAQVHQDAEAYAALGNVEEPELLIHEAVRLLGGLLESQSPAGRIDEAIDAIGRDLLRAAP
jgi:hypothetical protein